MAYDGISFIWDPLKTLDYASSGTNALRGSILDLSLREGDYQDDEAL
jgi:hypothetical protein